MRFFLFGLLCVGAFLAFADGACAQIPANLGQPVDVPSVPTLSPPADTPDMVLFKLQEAERDLRLKQIVAQNGFVQDESLKKQVELLQKQIATQQKMILLLQEQMKSQPGTGISVENLESKIATLDARSKQAAQRDVEIAQAIDKLVEQRDADWRFGPNLPGPVREMFLPSRTNESPLSIYGQFLTGYQQKDGTAGAFNTPDFSPYFLLKLNERFLLQANVDISGSGSVSLGLAEMNWFANDWLTVVAGRSLTPIGYYNERLGHEWINRLPDQPLMFRQVSPLISTDGGQLRGAFYLFGSPVKFEYEVYGGNGYQLANIPGTGTKTILTDVMDLNGIIANSAAVPAYGGRVGIWIPEIGLTTGLSTYHNGPWTPGTAGAPAAIGVPATPGLPGSSEAFDIWQFDFGIRKNGFDFRFEYAEMNQQTASFIGANLVRQGLYAQLAYRPLDAETKFIRNSEIALRYSRVRFYGVDQTQIDPSAFNSPLNVPVDRDQYTIGYNYYFSPGMAFRAAYEINREWGFNLNDNMFLVQYVWAF